MHHRPLAAAAALTFAVLGCGPVPATRGELGAGRFTYLCDADLYDAACADSSEGMVEMPTKVAVHAPFEVSLYADLDGSSSALFSASELILDSYGGTFRFVKPGFSAILAREPSGAVIDFLHVEGREIFALQPHVSGKLLGETLELTVGDSSGVTIEPTDSEGDILAGRVDLTWTSSADSVEILSAGFRNQRFVHAIAEGTAQVTVSGAGKTRIIQVIVGGKP